MILRLEHTQRQSQALKFNIFLFKKMGQTNRSVHIHEHSVNVT